MAGLYEIYSRKLANKLILTLSFIVSAFIIAVIMLTYFQTTDIMASEYVDKSKAILKLTGQSIDSYIQQIDDLSLTLRKDEGGRLINILIEKESNYQNDMYIQNRIQDLFSSRSDIKEVRFYIPSSEEEFYISKIYANVRAIYNIDKKEEEWYKKTTTGKFFRYIEPGIGKNGSSGDFFTFHRALINITNQNTLAVISMSFNNSLLEKINWNEGGQKGEVLCIFGRDSRLFYCSDSNMTEIIQNIGMAKSVNWTAKNGSFRINIGDSEFLAVYDISEGFNWLTMKLIPVSVLDEMPRNIRNINFLLGCLCILLLVLAVGFVTNIITRSLHKLSRQMEKVGKGNFKIQAEVSGNDETARLAKKFNLMVGQIDELVNEQYISKINEKTAQLKALEAQINPHFLYNSLQAISTRSILSGNKDISVMIEALSHNFRYCIKGGDMVNISSEIKHINNYLILHKARFEDRLSVDVKIENDIPDVMIPKLSIHTLVENSIKHCLEHIKASLVIKVHTFMENGRIIIEVEDSGPGMTEEKLNEIRNELKDHNWLEKINERIGLINLNARLKLIYDGDASLEIVESSVSGTRIRMVIPSEVKENGGNV
jgi:Predicted signal transduction protein with a C-terminal ATPase domain